MCLRTPTLAGLGDIAVPGLLACLALRYDASRSTDFRGRQLAAAQALQASLDASQVRGRSSHLVNHLPKKTIISEVSCSSDPDWRVHHALHCLVV